MKRFIKNIVISFASLVIVHGAIAQQGTSILTGTFTEKANAELLLVKTVNNKIQKLGEYTVNPSKPEFAFAVPADTTINYTIQVKTLKQGHMRLETDKQYKLPLTLKPGTNYSLKVSPSKLDAEKKTGWELKTATGTPPIAYVSGKLTNWNLGADMSIQRVVEGGYETINSISSAKGASFLLPCVINQEGFYYLSSLRWRLRIYLKPSDKLELSIDGKFGSYTIVNGSEENQSLQKWQQLIAPVTGYGYNSLVNQGDSIDLNTYLKTYQALEPSMADFRNSISHANPKFSKLFGTAIEVDKDFAPILYLFNTSGKRINGFRSIPKNFNDVPAFYQRFIQANKFSDAGILNIGEGKLYMNLYCKLVIASMPEDQRKKLTRAEKLGVMINAISNDTLKSYLLKDQMSEIELNNLTEFRSTFEPYKKYASAGPAKKKYQDVYNQFISDTAYVGKSSYNFTLPDSTGRMISMKDFKGKVVFIDVWATWCGPCREQFPFFKEIEETYKDNKDIVFVGISIDMAKSRQKWLDMMHKENLHGIQLFDDMGKFFANKYQITAIPRFLLVGKDGKWIEVRCPRPEAKEDLKKYIDKALVD